MEEIRKAGDKSFSEIRIEKIPDEPAVVAEIAEKAFLVVRRQQKSFQLAVSNGEKTVPTLTLNENLELKRGNSKALLFAFEAIHVEIPGNSEKAKKDFIERQIARIRAEIFSNEDIRAHLFEFELKADLEAEESEEDRELKETAERLLKNPMLLYEIKRALDKRIVGECDTKLLLFLICCSKDVEPQACYLVAESSTGKTYLVQQIRELFLEDFLWYSRLTPSTLDRIGKNLTGKVFVIGEDVGIGEAAASLRQWISEGQLRLLTTEKGPDGNIHVVEVETTGKPVVITTTTKAGIDSELATRIWVLTPDTSEEQTKRILKFEAETAAGKVTDTGDRDFAVIRKALQILREENEGKQLRILVPFAEKLAESFPAERVRARRDFAKIIGLIKVSAWLHQRNRPVIDRGSERIIVATLADLAAVSRIVLKSIKPTLTGLTPTHEAILSIGSEFEEFTTYDLTPELKLSAKRVHELIRDLIEWGYVEKVEGGPGRKNKYKVVSGQIENGQFPTISDGNLASFFTETELSEWLNSNFWISDGDHGVIKCLFFEHVYDPIEGVAFNNPKYPSEDQKLSAEEGDTSNNESEELEFLSEITGNSGKRKEKKKAEKGVCYYCGKNIDFGYTGAQLHNRAACYHCFIKHTSLNLKHGKLSVKEWLEELKAVFPHTAPQIMENWSLRSDCLSCLATGGGERDTCPDEFCKAILEALERAGKIAEVPP